MKRILLLLACISTLNVGKAQQISIWQKIDDNSLEAGFYGFVGGMEDYSLAIITKPMAKGATGDPVCIRKFNEDFSSYEDNKFQEHGPSKYRVLPFSNMIVMNGHNGGSYLTTTRDITPEQQIKCFTQDGALVGEFKLHIMDAKSTLNGDMVVYPSADKTKLILTSNEIYKASNTLSDASLTRIFVMDENFNMIWRDSMDLEKVYGDGVLYKNIQCDFTSNGKLVLMTSRNGAVSKNLKTQLTVAVFDAPGHEQSRDVKEFAYESIEFKHLLKEDGILCITGITYLGAASVLGNGYQRFFFLKKNPDNTGFTTEHSTEIQKEFYEAYPDYASYLKKQLGPPSALLQMNDGMLYISQFAALLDFKPYTMGITLIKFSEEGKFQWLKMINKYVYCGLEGNMFFKAYNKGSEVLLFYADNPVNVNNPKLKVIKSKENFALVMALVSTDGTIKKTVLDDRIENPTMFDINSLYQVDENRYLIKGVKGVGQAQPLKFARTIQF